MIPPHSDARVAEQAGFPARTLTGVCLLARAVSRLGRELELDLASVRRLAASFTAPVFIDAAEVRLRLRFWEAPAAALAAGGGRGAFFEVLVPAAAQGAAWKHAIRSGFVEWGSAESPAGSPGTASRL